MTKQVGIYAGTFDPVHAGHVAFAKSALQACMLDEVVFLPDRTPRAKQGVTDITHRLALLEHAVADEPGLRAVGLESGRFTARLVLPELQRLLGDSELVLLMGSDLARSLHAWDYVEELLAVVSLVVGLRRDDTAADIDAAMKQLMQLFGPVTYQIISVPHPAAASSDVRRGDHAALHPEVSAYIKRHGLYGAKGV